jgi:glyoxylase-like metal-dependent hydrolase (beta-lactamase superfamily II)
LTSHLRVLHPAPGILAFYDGRVAGCRFAPEPNWVDEGAISLGIASYAILDGGQALVYDTHVSVEDGRAIRRTLETAGARQITVLLSHWHLDHVAGTEAFADCEVIATARSAELLDEKRGAIEAGTLEGPPAIAPLLLPTRTFEGEIEIAVGSRRLRAIHVDIHSDDAAILWEPASATLLAGDTVEDTVTFVDEPQSFEAHLRDSTACWRWVRGAFSPTTATPRRSSAAATGRICSAPPRTTSASSSAAGSGPSCGTCRCARCSPPRCSQARCATSSPTRRSIATTSAECWRRRAVRPGPWSAAAAWPRRRPGPPAAGRRR